MVNGLDALEDMQMSNEKVKQTSEIIIGTKQTVTALKSGIVQEVIVAKDANDRMTEQIVHLALKEGIQIGLQIHD